MTTCPTCHHDYERVGECPICGTLPNAPLVPDLSVAKHDAATILFGEDAADIELLDLDTAEANHSPHSLAQAPTLGLGSDIANMVLVSALADQLVFDHDISSTEPGAPLEGPQRIEFDAPELVFDIDFSESEPTSGRETLSSVGQPSEPEIEFDIAELLITPEPDGPISFEHQDAPPALDTFSAPPQTLEFEIPELTLDLDFSDPGPAVSGPAPVLDTALGTDIEDMILLPDPTRELVFEDVFPRPARRGAAASAMPGQDEVQEMVLDLGADESPDDKSGPGQSAPSSAHDLGLSLDETLIDPESWRVLAELREKQNTEAAQDVDETPSPFTIEFEHEEALAPDAATAQPLAADSNDVAAAPDNADRAQLELDIEVKPDTAQSAPATAATGATSFHRAAADELAIEEALQKLMAAAEITAAAEQAPATLTATATVLPPSAALLNAPIPRPAAAPLAKPAEYHQGMSYYEVLRLGREPFSNSPDPDLIYPAFRQQECLRRLEISIRLRRGLNVVLGDVGTGKTTICRQLHRTLADDPEVMLFIFLEPIFRSGVEFLRALCEVLAVAAPVEASEQQLVEAIKVQLFQLGVEQGKTVALLIDEGQRLAPVCIELLRLLLNYETNDAKLLQIVIFGQLEFGAIIRGQQNFSDRINELIRLEPFTLKETREMIAFRVARVAKPGERPRLFSYAALWLIYRLTRGYPRKIVSLCHKIVLNCIVRERTKAGPSLVLASLSSTHVARPRPLRVVLTAVVFLLLGLAVIQYGDRGATWFAAKFAQRTASIAPTPVAAPRPQAVPALESRPDISGPPAPSVSPTPASPAPQPPAEAPQSTAPLAGAASGAAAAATAKPSAPVLAPGMPTTLGALDVLKGDLLSTLIREVYGSFNPATLKLTENANVALRGGSQLQVGMRVQFPAAPAPVAVRMQETAWVRLAEDPELNAGFALYREMRSVAPDTLFLPYWTPDKGLRFAVFLKRAFSARFDAPTALEGIAELPPALQKRAEVVSEFPSGTVFYGYKTPKL